MNNWQAKFACLNFGFFQIFLKFPQIKQFFNMVLYLGLDLDLDLGLGFNLDLGLGLGLESKSVTSW